MITNPIIPIWFMILLLPLFWFFKSKNKKIMVRQILILILIFGINLRIMIPTGEMEINNNNLDVLFVIDTTISMVAQDYNGEETRLSAVKEDCKYIMEELNGAKFSVITFDNMAKILLPYTNDRDILYETIDVLNVSDYFYARGTSLNEPLDIMLKQLEVSAKNDGRLRVVFMFTDGEITDNSSLDSYTSLADYINDGAILGYGTAEGGYMIVKDSLTEEIGYVEDTSSYPYARALSKIDENNLKKIASDLKVDYVNMNKQSNIDDKLEDIKSGATFKFSSIDKSSYEDTYYILLVPLLGLLIYEFITFRRGL